MYVVLLAMTYKQVGNNVRSTASNDIQTSKNNVRSTASDDIQTSRKQCT